MSEAEPCLSPPRVIAIGTSAGGLEALSLVLGSLLGTFPLPILIVQHLSPDHRSRLASLLQARSPLCVAEACEGECVRAGHVYVSPPNRHLGIDELGRIRLLDDPPVRFSRPSVDVLFHSLASAAGARGVAVVLTGAGSDGARGAREVHDAGGLVIVQDEASSASSGMPHAAIRSGVADHVLPLEDIAPFLTRLSQARGDAQ